MLRPAAHPQQQQQVEEQQHQLLPWGVSSPLGKRQPAPPAASASLEELTSRLSDQLSLSISPAAAPPATAAAAAAAVAAVVAAPAAAAAVQTAAKAESPEVMNEVAQLLQPLPALLHKALQQQQQQDEQEVVLLLQGVRGLRQLLSAAGEIPIAACLRAGALPLLVGCLAHKSKALMVSLPAAAAVPAAIGEGFS